MLPHRVVVHIIPGNHGKKLAESLERQLSTVAGPGFVGPEDGTNLGALFNKKNTNLILQVLYELMAL